MSFIKKLLILKNYLGLVIVGAIFAIIGGVITFKTDADQKLVPICFTVIGLACVVVGLMKLVKEIKTPTQDHKQYDRVDLKNAPAFENRTAYNEADAKDYVFHFTGKANQSYVMEDKNGNAVYEATTDEVIMIGGRTFTFRNLLTGLEEVKKVGATTTTNMGVSEHFGGITISSSFKIDGQNIWDYIAEKGYGFELSLNGVACHYDVKHWGDYAGYAELGGTGLVNPKYADSLAGKVPTNGIFKVHCTEADVEGLFIICMAVTLTDLVLD